MHMADALVSPAVAGTMWAASAGAVAYSSRKVRQQLDERLVPLMGVLGAFIFTAQMINFTIPGTGSSGHLGGCLLLSMLLGPHAAFLTIASVLLVQALFFADGGLLALGCNIFNLGFVPAFICYRFIYRPMAGDIPGPRRRWVASLVAAVAALQLGALGVVLETTASGIAQLPFQAFLLLMQPIHLAIGIVEGVVTAALVAFIAKTRPDILPAQSAEQAGRKGIRGVVFAFLAAAFITGGLLSWYASSNPDGLEWSIRRVSGQEQLPATGTVHRLLAGLQEKMAIFPDYSEKKTTVASGPETSTNSAASVSGVLGGGLTLVLALLAGFLLKCRRSGAWRPSQNREAPGDGKR